MTKWLTNYLFYFSFFEPIGILMILWNGDIRPSIPTGFLSNSTTLAKDPKIMFLVSIFLSILGFCRFNLSLKITSKKFYQCTILTSFLEIFMFIGYPLYEGNLDPKGYFVCFLMIMLPIWMLLTYDKHLNSTSTSNQKKEK